MVAFLFFMFLIEYHLPKKFIWNPTFSNNDYQPLGCAIFDDVMAESYGDSVSYICDKTLYELAEDSLDNAAILAISENMDLDKYDFEALFRLLDQGNKVMLVASGFSDNLMDTLNCMLSYTYFNPAILKKYATTLQRDTLVWIGDSVYSERNFTFFPQLCGAYFADSDSSATVLVERNNLPDILMKPDSIQDSLSIYRTEHSPVAMSYTFGKGELILVSTPLLFTNYGVLDGNNADYIFRLLNRMKDCNTIWRIEAYGVSSFEEQTPFRYFLSEPSLRWGLNLSILLLILFMIFTARRRQRPIPVIRDPENKSLEFTELIGTLYFQKKNHADLVCKKFTYMAEQLRRNIQVDVEDDKDDLNLSQHISRKTGLDEEGIYRLFTEIRPVLKGGRKVSSSEMKWYIDKMNEITHSAK